MIVRSAERNRIVVVLLLSCSLLGCCFVWSVPMAAQLARAQVPAPTPALVLQSAHNGPINSVAFQPGGKILATASNDGTIRLWDLASQKLIRVLTNGSAPVLGIAFHPGGAFLMAASLDGTLTCWKPQGGTRVWSRKRHDDWATCVRYSGRQDQFLSGDATANSSSLAANPEASRFSLRT